MFSKTSNFLVKPNCLYHVKNVYGKKQLSRTRCVCIKHVDHKNVAVFTKSWEAVQVLPFPYKCNGLYRPKEAAQGHLPTLATTEWPNLRKCI